MAEILPDGTFQSYSCAGCGGPCGFQGHIQTGESIQGVWVRYEDHEMGFSVRTCDADYEEKKAELLRRVELIGGPR